MKQNFSTQIIARVALWGFILATEVMIGHAMKEWRHILGHYETYIATACITFLASLCFGKSNLTASFQDLCLYDVLIQCFGWYSFHYGLNMTIYLTFNYSVLTLKFIRLLWPFRAGFTNDLQDWPVIGPFCYQQLKMNADLANIRDIKIERVDKFVYLAIFLVIPVIFTIREMGVRMPLAFWALLGASLLLRYFSQFLAYLDKQQSEFIENKAKAAVVDITKAQNAALELKNFELEQAKEKVECALYATYQAEQARDEAESAKANEESISRALRTTAHDLRQQISLIGFAGQDMIKASTLAEREEALKTFYDVNHQVTQAIEQIMYYAKLTTGQAKPKLEALELCSTLNTLCTQWRSAGFEKGIDALVSFPWRPGVQRYVACDPMLVNHVLQNLLINAISHAGPSCDRIVLCVRNRTDHYLVQVRDCGQGIAQGAGPDERANFAAFAQRVVERGAQRGDGHGLGINIVKQMCDVAQIEIGLRSRPGQGACFSLRIAKASAELIATTLQDAQERAKARETAKVLWRAQAAALQ